MKISTIIPTYNSSRTLARAINSVVQQTLPAYEIIVVDDGSSDDTLEVIKKFKKIVKYIKQNNSGVSVARNTGINVSSGDWIAFLDSDDEWLPNKLELQLDILRLQPALRWCAGEVKRVGKVNGSMARIFNKHIREIDRTHSIQFFYACLEKYSFQTSTFLISRQVFSEVGLFDPFLKVSEDRDLWWRIAARYPEIAYVHDVCAFYFVDTPSSLTKINNNRTDSLRVVCRHIQRIRKERSGIAPYYEKYVRYLCFRYLLRYASREIILPVEEFNIAKNLMNLTTRERIILKFLQLLPQKCSQIIVRLESRTTRVFV